jgi:SAM-dependent methyltransferase
MNGRPPTLPDPAPLMALITGCWAPQLLFAVNQLGLIPALAEAPATAAGLAERLSLDRRATALLCNAAAALALIEHDGEGRYRPTAAAAAYLVPGAPAYLGDAVRWSEGLVEAWSKLAATVRSGRPAIAAEHYLGGDAAATRAFVLGMHHRAQGVARALVHVVDLAGRRHLLDVGGGPGTYAALFVERTPGLTARVLDLPAVTAIAADLIAAQGLSDRVSLIAGDYHTTPFPEGVDVILMSGMFHRERSDACQDLIRRALAALAPGGLIVISDVFTDKGGESPPFATLFGVTMFLTAPDGGVHADTDVASWLEGAGFVDVEIRPLPPPLPHRVVLGRKG